MSSEKPQDPWPESFPVDILCGQTTGQLLDRKGKCQLSGGQVFETLSKAAVAVGAPISVNGWRFWSAFRSDGAAAPLRLDHLKKKKLGPFADNSIRDGFTRNRIKKDRERVWPVLVCSCCDVLQESTKTMWDVTNGLVVSVPDLARPSNKTMDEICMRIMLAGRCGPAAHLRAVANYTLNTSGPPSFVLSEPAPNEEELTVRRCRCTREQAESMCAEMFSMVQRWGGTWAQQRTQAGEDEECTDTPIIMRCTRSNMGLCLLPGPALGAKFTCSQEANEGAHGKLSRAVLRFCLDHIAISAGITRNLKNVHIVVWIPIQK